MCENVYIRRTIAQNRTVGGKLAIWCVLGLSSGRASLTFASKIYAWKIRGLLPHAVESTAFLTDAVLHDNVDINSTFAIRAVYSTAFCRYVIYTTWGRATV